MRRDTQMSATAERTPEIKKILVPIDGSDYSERAIGFAVEMARLSSASLIFLHSVPIPYYTSQLAGGLLLRQKYLEDSKIISNNLVSHAKDVAVKAGIPGSVIESEVLYDVASVPDSIVHYATNSNTDMIIMGSKGLSGVKKFLLGSVAEGVVRHASCPVLVVK